MGCGTAVNVVSHERSPKINEEISKEGAQPQQSQQPRIELITVQHTQTKQDANSTPFNQSTPQHQDSPPRRVNILPPLENKGKMPPLDSLRSINTQSQRTIGADIIETHSEIEESLHDSSSPQKSQMAADVSLPLAATGRLFMFGQSENDRKILTFQAATSQFKVVSHRERNSKPDSKYQPPQQVILEQSQQLLASTLYNKHSNPPYNFMFATPISPHRIFLCGGTTANLQHISEEAFVYRMNADENKTGLIGAKFDRLKSMSKKSYKNKIYVFGGHSGGTKRSKTIQIYDPAKGVWDHWKYKLHRGIQAGILCSGRPNQLLILGGNTQTGPLKTVLRWNLAKQTYQWDTDMKHARLLQKGLPFDGSFVTFGGDSDGKIEKYTLGQKNWKEVVNSNFKDTVTLEDINSFSAALLSVQVEADEQPPNTEPKCDYERIVIFGNDEYPLILEIDTNKWVLRRRPVPMALRLRTAMGCIRLKQGKYLLAGGIDSGHSQSTKSAYFYYANANTAIQLPKMSCKRYSFAMCAKDNYVYVFGGLGRTQKDYLSNVERYCLDTQKWQQLPSLQTGRADGQCIACGQHIVLFSGSNTLGTVCDLEILNTGTLKLYTHPIMFPLMAQVKFATLLGHGMNNGRQSSKILILAHNDVLHANSLHMLTIQMSADLLQAPPQLHPADLSLSSSFQSTQLASLSQSIGCQELPADKYKPPGAFDHAFRVGGSLYIVSQKGVMTMNISGMLEGEISSQSTLPQPNTVEAKPTTNDTYHISSFRSQVLINQTELLMFPIHDFAMATE